jgi:hypothetical protein
MAIIEGKPSRGNRNKEAKGLGSFGEALTKAVEALPTPPVGEQPAQASAETETEVLKEEAVKPFLQSLGELNPGPTRRIFINDVEVTASVIKQHDEDAKKAGTKEELRKECLELLDKTHSEIDSVKAKLRQADDVMAIQAYAAQLGKLEAIKNDLYAAGVVTPNEYQHYFKDLCKETIKSSKNDDDDNDTSIGLAGNFKSNIKTYVSLVASPTF